MNAFTTCFTKIDPGDDSGCSDEDNDKDLTFEELKMLRKEDTEARAIQNERIQDLMEENERLMLVISSLQLKLKEVQNDYDQTIKYVKMLNSETENLDSILKSRQNSSSKYGLGFDASVNSLKSTYEIKFVPALVKAETETTLTTTVVGHPVKSPRRICYHYADREYHRKWDVKSEQGIFLGYSQNSRAYRVFNNRSGTVMETINVVVNDFESTAKRTYDENDKTPNMSVDSSTLPAEVPKADAQNHPSSSIIGDPSAGIITKKKEKVDYLKMITDLCYTSAIEPLSVDVALKDDYWLNTMQEELLQFRPNNVWTLVPKPEGATIIIEWVDFDETFVPVARLEAICLLLGISCIQRFKLYQMNVKSAFLNDYLNEEVYAAQPKGFIDSEYPQHVYKLNKALYRLKQALRACQPDIAYVVGICARYQADPRTSHLEAVKRIIKYAHGTSDFGILYFYDMTSILVGYCDADWAEVSNRLSKSVPETVDSPNHAPLGTYAPNVPETLLFDMDLDDLDDVPSARLLKKTTIPEHTSNVQPGPSMHSPLSESLPSESNVAHASVPCDVSAEPEVRTDVRNKEDELDPPNPNIHSEEVPAAADNNPTVPHASPEIPIASQPAKRKSQQNRCNITTKTNRKKIPPNIPSVPIDGISFHHEENVQRWKFLVQRRLADELIREFIVNLPDEFNDPSSPDYQTVHIRGFKFVISPTVINGFLENVVVLDCSSSSPSTEVLASVLSGGTLSLWPVNGIPAVALSVKYAILHKIGGVAAGCRLDGAVAVGCYECVADVGLVELLLFNF
ncbi:gag-pol polyprotein [Cucumis melo var. makuwa]|uniref:Gag-pol polyprotein n=1 Tax=Cucumis melo var. makuwa TaxID=1194695 RepID=A0A5A7STQ8_CUCMM|nr:gag-pol polyprotein [Cucumis melo var. makuwa]